MELQQEHTENTLLTYFKEKNIIFRWMNLLA